MVIYRYVKMAYHNHDMEDYIVIIDMTDNIAHHYRILIHSPLKNWTIHTKIKPFIEKALLIITFKTQCHYIPIGSFHS